MLRGRGRAGNECKQSLALNAGIDKHSIKNSHAWAVGNEEGGMKLPTSSSFKWKENDKTEMN